MNRLRLLNTYLFLSVFLILLSVLYLFPILKPFPEPSGPFQVGTQAFKIVDQQRDEPYAPGCDGKRSVMVRFWYPAAVQTDERLQYVAGKMPILQQLYAALYSIPLWISALLWRNIITHSYVNAPLSRSKEHFPIILFSHGLFGLPSDMYVSLIENIASNGYFIVGIDHPYFNIITQYPDGSVVSSNELSAKFQKMRPHEQRAFQANAINEYIRDMKLVISELEKLNQDKESTVYQRLDLTRIGVVGHSAGGTAAIEFCRNSQMCKVAIDLDGWYDHVIRAEPLRKPLLLLFASESLDVGEPTPEYLQRKEITRDEYFEQKKRTEEHIKSLCSASECFLVLLDHTSHEDFSDAVLAKWPMRRWYAQNSYKVLESINSRIVDFLQKYLIAK
ncbi:MAG TPA: alpha/beta fold hydrolase [Candidatus Babeliales bacterium]|nr:alpha/beta fold hydrolase [Candidatus Babeliales bacterium]